VAEQPHDHHYNREQEHEERYAVHPVHKLQVEGLGRIRISLTEVEVRKHLIPDTVFHKPAGFR